jgi:hypothetical protein
MLPGLLRLTLPALILLLPQSLAAQPLSPVQRIEASSDLAGKRSGRPARDISGIACLAEAGAKRLCLLVNDENKAAQFATLRNGRLEPGAGVPLIADAAGSGIRGTAPVVACRQQGGFGEFDGEGVAGDGRHFYVTGSHGCSRNSASFRASSFLLARVPIDGRGTPELSWRVSDLLRKAGEAAPFFGKDLGSGNGLNIEGLAIVGERAWFGLRAPSLGGKAFLVGADIADLFAPGTEPARRAPAVVDFAAGENRGVRDLAALDDGKLLVLVGPAQEQSVPYALLLVDPADGSARPVGTLPARGEAKAEALAILSESRTAIDVLIGYDGPDNGAFETYRISLR